MDEKNKIALWGRIGGIRVKRNAESGQFDEAFVQQILIHEKIVEVLKSVEQGAATTVLAAVGREWEGRGGKYLEDCEEAERGADDGDFFNSGWVKQTYDEVEEGRLWKDSLDIVGMKDDL